MAQDLRVDLTTGTGIICFPKLSKAAAADNKNDKGEPQFTLMFVIPKSQKADVAALKAAIAKVGKAKWGAKWSKVRNPLRDGDAEADEMTDSGETKGEKYPERLGCYFINVRSSRAVGIYDRARDIIDVNDPDNSEIYSGVKAKVALSLYPYSVNGNLGIGVGLNGVQKVGEGDMLGAARPSVESMFDDLGEPEEDEYEGYEPGDEDEEDEEEPEEKPAPRKRAAAKKTPARRKPEPEPEEDEYEGYEPGDEDEDEDEEEPEEKPAPRKRAAAKKAPARRPAKKAAPARRRKPVEEDEDEDLYEDLDDDI